MSHIHATITLEYSILVFLQDFNRLQKGTRCQKRNKNVLKEFVFPTESFQNATEALVSCEQYCAKTNICWGCSIDCREQCQWNAITDCGSKVEWTGLGEGDITHKPGTNKIYGSLYLDKII